MFVVVMFFNRAPRRRLRQRLLKWVQSRMPDRTPTLQLLHPTEPFFAASEKHRLLVQATPKGGATLAVQLVLRAEGLEAAAAAHVGRPGAAMPELGERIHAYHVAVLVPNRTVRGCDACGGQQSSWCCLKLVRSPWDRAVSSYLRTASAPARSHLPEMRTRGSFEDFLGALRTRAGLEAARQRRLAQRPKSDHYLPQVRPQCDEAMPLVPIECAEQALRLLGRGGRRCPAYRRLAATNLSARGHYRVQSGAPQAPVCVPL